MKIIIDPYLKAKLLLILKIVLFVLFTAVVIFGHSVEGIKGVGIMMAGLLCLLGLLYVYNRSYVDAKPKKAKQPKK